MSTAFILGNGKSRLSVDLTKLSPLGATYGCNWLCKTFSPDCLVATDRPIADAIQQSGYAQKHRFHTRKPIVDLGGKHLSNEYKGFSSGPNAAALACIDGHSDIYLIGMDLGTTNGMFNNVYVDTQFYKKELDPPTYAGNWINQLVKLTEDYPSRQFYRVEGIESAFVKQFGKINNMKIMNMESFLQMVNTARGPL
jgi:hypothetical protein